MNIGVIGIGSMGGMLVRALIRSGASSPHNVWVANRSKTKLEALVLGFPGIHVVDSLHLAAHCDLIFVCVGVTDLPVVFGQIDSSLNLKQLLITTSAAVPLEALQNRVPCKSIKLIPSVTQELGVGISLLMYGSRVSAKDRTLLEGLLSRFSQPVVIDESLGRPAVGLTSGGPALIAYLLKTMAEEAVRSNARLSAELANKLVQETATARL